ncbi:uncharacterized protein DNG_03816 [Cephalotrichum gorgonifer]|uniref:Uncharacterized protein n=1 Tax=Cephalotrichum gorgonifer TaxID=2041049 RepID=A0AAE8MWU9_9PEZI|nr:uncharacterized protein DNG_03816 [Cephalotrichum gorgonifer]
MTMMRPEPPQNLGWGFNGSVTTPSPSWSPRSSNVSLSPVPRQSMPVSSLLNGDASSDEESWARLSSSPRTSRLSTPSDSGSDVRPEVNRTVGVTLPGFNDIARLADSLSATPTPAIITGTANTTAPIAPVASWAAPDHYQRTQLPTSTRQHPSRPHHHLQSAQHGPRLHHSLSDHQLRIQKKQRKPPSYPPGHTRNNKKYTTEQVDFTLYFRVDKKLSWQEVIPAYERQFPSEGSNRTRPGLQGCLYRENLSIPVLDENGDLTFTEEGNMKVRMLKVREQKDKIGLLDRYPNRAIDYSWVSEEDKRKIWHRGRRHQEQIARMAARQQTRQALPPSYSAGPTRL